ncbi:MAG: hypothetical protein ACYS6W_03735 [Planctomycetota bacterium]|jgi:hypothetical protein
MIKPKRPVTAVLGFLVISMGAAFIVYWHYFTGFIPCLIGLSLIYLAFRPSRGAVIIFGHLLLVTGCLLVTWGVYLLPYSKPTLAHIFGRPLFWGLFSILGGICVIYHGFCRCFSSSSTPSQCNRDTAVDTKC